MVKQLRELLQNPKLSRLDNRLLLSKVTGFNHVQLIIYDEYVLSNAQYQYYLELVNRATGLHEPIAYILGYREFYGRNFRITTDTLIPRPETEMLVDRVIASAPPQATILDLGTGSGCIAISCKLERPDLVVYASDFCPNALNIAQQNATDLTADIIFIHSNWFENIQHTLQFDLIVANPPYIEKDDFHLTHLSYEPQHALTDFGDGLSAITCIITHSQKFLKGNGTLMLEHGYNQAQKIQQILTQNSFIHIATYSDYAELERVTIASKPNFF